MTGPMQLPGTSIYAGAGGLWVVEPGKTCRLLRLDLGQGRVEGMVVPGGVEVVGVLPGDGTRVALRAPGGATRWLAWPGGEPAVGPEAAGRDYRWWGARSGISFGVHAGGIDAYDGRHKAMWTRRLTTSCWRAAFSPDGTHVAVGMAEAVGIFRTSDGEPVERIGVRKAPLHAFAVDEAWRSWFLLCHQARVVYRTGMRAGGRVFETTCIPPGVSAMESTPGGALVCATRDGVVGVWRSADTPTGRWTVLTTDPGDRPSVGAICVPNAGHAATLRGGTVDIVPVRIVPVG